MFIPICISLFGALLFGVGMQMYYKSKGDVQSAKIYSFTCYIGFMIWFGVLAYFLFEYVFFSFDVIDCLIVFCCLSTASVLILSPAWGKNKHSGILAPVLVILFLVDCKMKLDT